MNRKLMVALLLAGLVAAAGAFASGNKEDKAPQQGQGFYGPGPYGCPGPGAWGRGGRGYGRGYGPWMHGRGAHNSNCPNSPNWCDFQSSARLYSTKNKEAAK